MIPLDQPEVSSHHAYSVCMSTVQDGDKKLRYSKSSSAITPAEKRYIKAACDGLLHLEHQDNYMLPSATVEDMVWLYDKRMAAKKSTGRMIYDQLILSSRDGMCALCGALPAASLDHYLPKAKFPALAVSPVNLVPVCQSCNHSKGSYTAACAADSPVHPYFDNFNDDIWLTCVVDSENGAVTFEALPPDSWEPERAGRIVRHFENLHLAAMYSSFASQAIQGNRYELDLTFHSAGALAVRDELDRKARSWRTFDLNSWQAALFSALASSDWYCEGGYAL